MLLTTLLKQLISDPGLQSWSSSLEILVADIIGVDIIDVDIIGVDIIGVEMIDILVQI